MEPRSNVCVFNGESQPLRIFPPGQDPRGSSATSSVATPQSLLIKSAASWLADPVANQAANQAAWLNPHAHSRILFITTRISVSPPWHIRCRRACPTDEISVHPLPPVTQCAVGVSSCLHFLIFSFCYSASSFFPVLY